MSNPPATIDDVAFTVSRTVRIDAPLSTVWTALTAPEHLAGWFGDRAEFPDGVHVGAEGTFGWPDHGDFPVRVVEFAPEERFAFTWGTPGEPIRADNSTTAHFTLDPDGDTTVVTVLETGFEDLGDDARRRAAMEDNRSGWTEELDQLVAYVATLARTDA
ncbi:Activator of Hsp90 ATPase 1 family protein [Beutenbergia cavernae DSM 12333]|uniref:Activator of Hsp90 ATPase 1 family protein n=1 Tax=Beutenbergia cavernae (strain ATCC BAA-8 / DSM 12333 / CCUG 43141 / JCM 11478 / NBRC 16432 / NCIMB 13614 / HKI 0122) TaxID=471853 RepID=C5C4I6_BEUC1|nr:SRPBCC family protein [Beutenbergia cavernae]ACQ82110.1 Activator of Hsp90 ATPase 1 family protein [Beutenbergia cavernae DSM 12333]